MTATVAALYRYPVKSFQGFAVDSLTVGPRGVQGDRRFALLDAVTDKILSAKVKAELLHATVQEAPDGAVRVTLPDGRLLDPNDDEANAALSAWIGRPVVIAEAEDTAEPLAYDERSRSYEMTFEPPNDDAEVVDIPSPAGTFLDLAAVHVLTTGSIERCRAQQPATDWDVRRFRPNVLVDTDDGGFPEDAWVGRRVRLGGAILAVEQRTVRCAMPLRSQPGGIERDVEVYRTMASVHENHLGVYCRVEQPGDVRVGDEVEPLD